MTELQYVDNEGVISEELYGRLCRYAQKHQLYRLMERHGVPVPAFDHFRDFWDNFNTGPAEPVDGGLPTDLPRDPTTFLGFPLDFPFGIPSCALTLSHQFIRYFA